MADKGKTRERIMDVAQASILSKGFEATSIDEIVAAVEITKGGFFYHFSDKNALARALLERYIEEEDRLFDDLFSRARELNEDPLHAMLIGLKLMAEMLDDIPKGHPGCLVATACYQERLFNTEVRELNRKAVLNWRERFLAMFEQIASDYSPRADVDLTDLADMLTGVVEGGIILSKAIGNPQLTSRQIMLYRTLVKTVFAPL
ncbi:TetR/AcrR family transcriptional regulator [Hoeflea prorocentri]|uniref:TetR/AcrR family transcriptional regulator n=1 Tax=Hoeflea prorocentri TaxID=1922333 RepID=A0A9X3ULS0_9HYPH|nr:TetR/AcrR family transcriptional regulator [Hoeflea prorocentri]MCY6382944.1 TetR/AcrR family transcriptional regulator [Hoeflea prorocentri]MDA5400744.1 TetR/AcrR family transcriptional regulator [Hoeflea prorocentri]